MNNKFKIENESKFIEKIKDKFEGTRYRLENEFNMIIKLKQLLYLFKEKDIVNLTLSATAYIGQDTHSLPNKVEIWEMWANRDGGEYKFEQQWCLPSKNIKKILYKCLEEDIKEKEKQYFELKDRYIKDKSEVI